MTTRRVAAALAVAMVVAGLSGCSEEDGTALPEPTSSSTTTTAEVIDYTQVSLQPVNAGKSPPVTKPPGPGGASISGRVVDGGAPVPGALIRATYYLDSAKPEVVETRSAADGTYRFDRVHGGRWRLRAWLVPTMATLEVSSFFLGAAENKRVDLKVKAVPPVAVTASMAPNPPLMDEDLVELAVRVMTQAVDGEGRVTRSTAAALPVTLFMIGSWSLQSANPQATDGDGTARWVLVCRAAGTQPITAFAYDQEFPLSVPACIDPATTTTTTIAEPASSTSTTPSTRRQASATTTTRRRAAPSTTRPATQAR